MNTVKSACVDIFPEVGIRQYLTRQEPFSRLARIGAGFDTIGVANPAPPGDAGGAAVTFTVVCSQEQIRTGVAAPSQACQWRSGKHIYRHLWWRRVETAPDA